MGANHSQASGRQKHSFSSMRKAPENFDPQKIIAAHQKKPYRPEAVRLSRIPVLEGPKAPVEKQPIF